MVIPEPNSPILKPECRTPMRQLPPEILNRQHTAIQAVRQPLAFGNIQVPVQQIAITRLGVKNRVPGLVPNFQSHLADQTRAEKWT